ncbi:MAG: FAD:protein FMN transferase, partial [Bacteroidales bacterium]|nr:FAD:protein FMN transferase [Bacteroidales bacterium]
MGRIVRIFISLTLLCAAFSCAPQRGYVTITGFAQGGTYAVKFNIEGVETAPEEIRDSINSILSNIDNSLSGYNRNSLLSAFNAGVAIKPDSLFLDIYERAYGFYDETEGVLDVASAPLFDIWGFGFRSGEMPDDLKVRETLASSGMKRLSRDIRAAAQDGTLTGMELLAADDKAAPKLNYNAIAQGYSCDVVAHYLYSLGVKDMMVDIGEIFCAGRNPSGKSWAIGIDRPVDGNNTLGADLQGIFRIPSGAYGVVTSGNYRK